MKLSDREATVPCGAGRSSIFKADLHLLLDPSEAISSDHQTLILLPFYAHHSHPLP